MLLLTDSNLTSVLDLPSCVDAVEAAFRSHGEGAAYGLNRIHVGRPGGAFHLVSGGYATPDAANFSVKLTGVIAPRPDGPPPRGIGIVILSDAANGQVLAVMDGRTITRMRTAAVSAVAAKYLARQGPASVLLVGAGKQAQAQVDALRCVREIRRVAVWSIDDTLTRNLVATLRETGADAAAAPDLHAAAREASLIISITPSTRPLLHVDDIAPGTFIAALGADAPEKQELDPALVAGSTLVVDVVAQCATAGELHHALAAGLMTTDDVYSDLGAIVAGRRPGRSSDDQVIVFDSTGTALQDAAVARLALTEGHRRGIGTEIDLAG